jgi:folate-dependent phosphoribosylglycinamide formyltransferase PurN
MKVKSKDIEELEKSIHKLEHELYPKVIQDFAKGNLKLRKENE